MSLREWFGRVRKKPAPPAKAKPLPPTPLESALQRIAEDCSEASQRLGRVKERLERKASNRPAGGTA